MTHFKKTITLDQPAEYLIELQGRLDPKWSISFDGMVLTHRVVSSGFTITRLQGIVADQSALHGLLNHIRDLGLPLISVSYLPGIRNQNEAQ